MQVNQAMADGRTAPGADGLGQEGYDPVDGSGRYDDASGGASIRGAQGWNRAGTLSMAITHDPLYAKTQVADLHNRKSASWLASIPQTLQRQAENAQTQSQLRHAVLLSNDPPATPAGFSFLKMLGRVSGRLQEVVAQLQNQGAAPAATMASDVRAVGAISPAVAITGTGSAVAAGNFKAIVAAAAGLTSDATALAGVTTAVQQRFSAQAADREGFNALLRQAFGDKFDMTKAEAIRQQALAGDFSWAPKIEVVDSQALADVSGTQAAGSALGAYVAETDTIYISRELLNSDMAHAQRLLMEEMGHAMDARINTSDTVGDEGEIFSKLMHGDSISAQQLADLKADNDHGVVNIGGRDVTVEYGWFKKAVKAITGGAKKLVESSVKVATGLATFNFSQVKDGLKEGADAVKDTASELHKLAKESFNKLMQSKLLSVVLAVCRFIPIPVVQMVVYVVNVARAAYMVYQGIKNKSLSMVLGGVASLAPAGAKFAGAIGMPATAAMITSIGEAASKLNTAYNAIANKDLGAAFTLFANLSGVKGTAFASAGEFAVQANGIYTSLRKGDTLGAVSGAIGLGAWASNKSANESSSERSDEHDFKMSRDLNSAKEYLGYTQKAVAIGKALRNDKVLDGLIGASELLAKGFDSDADKDVRTYLGDSREVLTGMRAVQEIERGNLEQAQQTIASLGFVKAAALDVDYSLARQRNDRNGADVDSDRAYEARRTQESINTSDAILSRRLTEAESSNSSLAQRSQQSDQQDEAAIAQRNEARVERNVPSQPSLELLPLPELYGDRAQWAQDNQQALDDAVQEDRTRQDMQDETRRAAQTSFRQSELAQQGLPLNSESPYVDPTPVNGSDLASDQAHERAGDVPVRTEARIIVGKDDTLEKIARDRYVGNWRAGMDLMARENHLRLNANGSPVIVPGQTLIARDLSTLSDAELARGERQGGNMIANNEKGLRAKAELVERTRQATEAQATQSSEALFGNADEANRGSNPTPALTSSAVHAPISSAVPRALDPNAPPVQWEEPTVGEKALDVAEEILYRSQGLLPGSGFAVRQVSLLSGKAISMVTNTVRSQAGRVASFANDVKVAGPGAAYLLHNQTINQGGLVVLEGGLAVTTGALAPTALPQGAVGAAAEVKAVAQLQRTAINAEKQIVSTLRSHGDEIPTSAGRYGDEGAFGRGRSSLPGETTPRSPESSARGSSEVNAPGYGQTSSTRGAPEEMPGRGRGRPDESVDATHNAGGRSSPGVSGESSAGGKPQASEKSAAQADNAAPIEPAGPGAQEVGSAGKVGAGEVAAGADTRASLLQLTADLRATLPSGPKTSGNMGVAQIDVPGIQSIMAASSQVHVPTSAQVANGFVGKIPEIFLSTVVPNARGVNILRSVDSEAKILNNVAAKLGDNTSVTGTINLFTERAPCPSCSKVISSFEGKYPNININVFDNNGIQIRPTSKDR